MKTSLFSLSVFGLGLLASDAALIYSVASPVSIPTDQTGIYLNVLTGATQTTEDIGFTNSHINFFFGGSGIGNGPELQPARSGSGNLDPVVNLLIGTDVDGSLTYSSGFGGSENAHIGAASNQFQIGQDGFIGFAVDQGGATHYGFIQVRLGNAGQSGEILAVAYEDQSDTAVTVIPEPSSLTLLSVLGGCLLLRRRS